MSIKQQAGFAQYSEMLNTLYQDYKSYETSKKPLNETKWKSITGNNIFALLIGVENGI